MSRTPLLLPLLMYARATAGLRRWLERSDRVAGAFLSAALTDEEKGELGIQLYDASPLHRGTALFPWEETWFRQRLPAAPARILVGACGAGREVLALAAAGHVVDAFEPARTLFHQARARSSDNARVLCFRYEDLSAAVLDGVDNPAAPLARERYDAVLLGWGSLTHVLNDRKRLRLMSALDRLCPRGPLLASFWCYTAASGRPVAGRAERYGAACGRRVATLRKLRDEPSPRELFALHAGFAYRFTKEEIETLATSVGRNLIWESDQTAYPHATFVRSDYEGCTVT